MTEFFLLSVVLKIETAVKLYKLETEIFLKKPIDEITRFNIPSPHMANEPAIDTVVLSFQIPISDKLRLKREAATRKMNTKKTDGISTYARFIIQEAVKDVQLTPEDYEEIAKTIRSNQKKRERKRSSNR